MITELLASNDHNLHLDAKQACIDRFGDDFRFWSMLKNEIARDISLNKSKSYCVSTKHIIETGQQTFEIDGIESIHYNYIELKGENIETNRKFLAWHKNSMLVIAEILQDFRQIVNTNL